MVQWIFGHLLFVGSIYIEYVVSFRGDMKKKNKYQQVPRVRVYYDGTHSCLS
jgi:hypothetical protein